jgi:hypothetical protein
VVVSQTANKRHFSAEINILNMPKCDVTLRVKYFKFLLQTVNRNTFLIMNVFIIIVIIIIIIIIIIINAVSVPHLSTCLLAYSIT